MIARLQPGVTLDYAWQRLDVVNKRTTERLPKLRKLVEDAKFQAGQCPDEGAGHSL